MPMPAASKGLRMNGPITPSILWIGRSELPEFSDTWAVLSRLTQVVARRTIEAALELDPADDCALVVVAEAFPGEHLAADYSALRRARPAVAIVRVYGSLCEGELRTNPPPPVSRYSWLAAPAMLAADWRRLERGVCPSWGQPAAATEEERLLADVPGGASTLPELMVHQVGLKVADPATAGWLTDFLQRRGLQSHRLGREIIASPPSLRTILWDRPSTAAQQAIELAELRQAHPQTPVIVLANFPRIDEVRQLRSCGVAAVLAKPLLPDELELVLRSFVDPVVP